MTISCPRCGEDTSVYKTNGDGLMVRRNRICQSCKFTFATLEIIGDNKEVVKQLKEIAKKGSK